MGFSPLERKQITYDSPKGSPWTFSLRTRILTIWGHLLPTLTVKMQKDWIGMYMVTLPPPAIHTPQGLHSVQQILQNRPRTRLLSPPPGPWRHRLSPESRQKLPASVSFWMSASPQNPYVEILTPQVMVFGGGPFRRWLGHTGKVLRNGMRAFIQEGPGSSLAPSTMGGHSEKSAIYELEGRSHQAPNLPVPCSQTSQPPELWEVNVHCSLATQSAVLCCVSPDELRHSPLPPYTCQKSSKVTSLLNTKPFFGFRRSRSRSGSPCCDLQGPTCSGLLLLL